MNLAERPEQVEDLNMRLASRSCGPMRHEVGDCSKFLAEFVKRTPVRGISRHFAVNLSPDKQFVMGQSRHC